MPSMTPFAHHRPATLDDALALMALHGPDARVIAGGTDLVPRLRSGAASAAHLVSVGRIAELSRIAFDPETGLVIGAGARLADVGRHPEVQSRYGALADALSVMATVQIRTMGTVAGNLANGSPCADTASPLLVHEARVELARQGSRREVALEAFFRGPREVDLDPAEVLVAIHVPTPAPGARSVYLRMSARSRVDMAAAGAAALLVLDSKGRVDGARLALTAVAPTPLRCPDAEALLAGQEPTADRLAKAAAACAAAARPIDDVRATAVYRRHVVGVLARRALERCVAGAKGGAR